jgi:hypothetical protein
MATHRIADLRRAARLIGVAVRDLSLEARGTGSAPEPVPLREAA